MGTKKYLWVLLSLFLAASMILASCAPQAAATPTTAPAQQGSTQAPAPTVTQPPAPTAASAKVLKARIRGDITNLDTANVTGDVEDSIDRAVMDGLFRYDANGELQPQLVDTYTVSSDGLTIDITLRKGVMWQRGYGELTMDDVKFSYERFLHIRARLF